MDSNSKSTAAVIDQGGWFTGVRASLKAIFGTDTEVHLRHGGVKEMVQEAKDAVGQMDRGAQNLLDALEDTGREDTTTEQTLQAIIEDL